MKKMKRTAAFAAAALLTATALAGCSSSDTSATTAAAAADTTAAAADTAAADAGSSEKGVVYGIYKAGDQTWFIDEGAAAQKKVEENGDEFIFVDAKMSPEEYLKAIDNAIANQAKGIVTCIPDQTVVFCICCKPVAVCLSDDVSIDSYPRSDLFTGVVLKCIIGCNDRDACFFTLVNGSLVH